VMWKLLSVLVVLVVLVAGEDLIFDIAGGRDQGLGGGFDIVDDLNVRPWVLKFAYTQKKEAQYRDKTYLIPDGVSFQPSSYAQLDSVTRLTESWSDYFTYRVKTTKISVGIKYEGFELGASFSASKGYVNNLLKNGTKSFAFNGGIFVSFSLQFRSAFNQPALDDDFKSDISKLPAAYNAAIYTKFLKIWGTHYFTRVYYGCQFNITIVADKKWQQDRTAKWTERQMDLTLKYKEFFEFGFKQEGVVNKSQIDGKFLDQAETKVQARGGEPGKFINAKDYQAWADSCNIQKVPIVPQSDIAPITDLITNPTIKANVKTAIIAYGKGTKK